MTFNWTFSFRPDILVAINDRNERHKLRKLFEEGNLKPDQVERMNHRRFRLIYKWSRAEQLWNPQGTAQSVAEAVQESLPPDWKVTTWGQEENVTTVIIRYPLGYFERDEE